MLELQMAVKRLIFFWKTASVSHLSNISLCMHCSFSKQRAVSFQHCSLKLLFRSSAVLHSGKLTLISKELPEIAVKFVPLDVLDEQLLWVWSYFTSACLYTVGVQPWWRHDFHLSGSITSLLTSGPALWSFMLFEVSPSLFRNTPNLRYKEYLYYRHECSYYYGNTVVENKTTTLSL